MGMLLLSREGKITMGDIRKLGLASAACVGGSVALLCGVLASRAARSLESHVNAGDVGILGRGDVYVGLSYSPAFSGISNFDIRESSGETAAVYPYYKDGTTIELKAIKFDWSMPNPKIAFRDNPLFAMEASMGYKVGTTRVELEVGYERFKPQGVKYTGSEEEEGDTLYLLAKRLPHTYLSGQSEEFAKELAATTAEDIVAFARAVGSQEPGIDKRVCGGSGAGTKSKCYHSDSSNGSSRFSEFGEGIRGSPHDWPHGKSTNHAGTGWTNSNLVALDLGKLDKEERWRIADMLSTTISGVEVVQIRAVSSTSVMLNACYDLKSEEFGAVPFACLGIGANFVGVVDGHITPKFAYKIKAGLSYALSPEVSVFASGFYNRVLGEGLYEHLPVKRLVDDITTNKTREYATASFKMAYTGAEFGVRLAF